MKWFSIPGDHGAVFLQRMYSADLDLARQYLLNPGSEGGIKPETDAAVGAEVPGDRDQLAGYIGGLQELFRAQGVMHRLEQHDLPGSAPIHGMTSFPAPVMAAAMSYMLETIPAPSLPLSSK